MTTAAAGVDEDHRPDSLAAQVGRQLAEARGGRTLRDFASAAGMSVATIHALEQGRDNPTLSRLERIARLYRVRLTILVERV